jgi:hypothetical protein
MPTMAVAGSPKGRSSIPMPEVSFMDSIASIAIPFFTGGLAGALVNYFLGPGLTWRQENIRRDRAVRAKMALAVDRFKSRLEHEKVLRGYLNRGGQITHNERLSVRDIPKFLWPIARGLADPDLSSSVRERVTPLLDRIDGPGTLRYLRTCETESEIGEGTAEIAFTLTEGLESGEADARTAPQDEPISHRLSRPDDDASLDDIIRILGEVQAIIAPWIDP